MSKKAKHSKPVAAKTVAELAGFRRRLVSMVYEALLLLGLAGATCILPYIAIGMVFSYIVPSWLMWTQIFVVVGFYFVWYWSRNGQTLAMQTWRLRLVQEIDGRQLSPARSWWRYVLAWPSVLLGGLGLLWALIDRDRQFLHDRLAGTCIVMLPKK